MTGASDLLTRDTVLTVGVSHEESSLTADHTTTSAPDHGTPSTVALTQCEQCGTVLDTGAMVAHTLTCPVSSSVAKKVKPPKLVSLSNTPMQKAKDLPTEHPKHGYEIQ